MNAKASCSPTKWDEKPYDQISPASRMTKATVEFAFKGDLEGTAFVEYLMFYESYDEKDPHAANAAYVGLMRFKGSVNGKKGSFVAEERGTFKGGMASSSLTLLRGSGTEELSGISGAATGSATQQGAAYEFDYKL